MSMMVKEDAVLVIQIYPTQGRSGQLFELQLLDRRISNSAGIEVQSFATEAEARRVVLQRIARS
jgi:hypothetical protein